MSDTASSLHIPASTHLATLFGIGRIPVMPGTIASLAVFPVGWWIGILTGWAGLMVAAILVFLLGWGVCGAHARRVGVKDPKECVLDEVAGQWLALSAIPMVDGFFHWLPLLLVFAGFRFFDIVKPWPISRSQRFEGGFGIMADDMIAGAVTAALVAAGSLTNLY
jgi:phosphatidylglycerophosphatase A